MGNVGKSISSVGDSLTNKITKPAMVAATALTGVTLVKGFNRLVGIDEAKAKLKGLGHDAGSVTEIMNSALDSVRGTSYGLDAAATTAAGAVAAGIPPGKELTRYLSLTGDAAAIAGTSMSDMGSIFNKVQTAQRAYTGDLNQLADRGLPIYQWIGEAAGKTAEQVRDMASDGKVSSEMFLSAIEKNIGGAAKIMGAESFKAALANMGASIARIGANFLDAGGEGKGFFSTLKPLIGDFTEWLGALEEKAKDWGTRFGEAFSKVIDKAMELKAKFDSLTPAMQGTILKSIGIGAAIVVGIGPALKVVGTLMIAFGKVSTVIAAVLSPVGLVVVAVAALAAGFIYMMNTSENFRNKVSELIGVLSNVFAGVKLLAQGFAEMLTNGPGERIVELREKFTGMFPEPLWNGMIRLSQGLNDIKAVIGAFVSVLRGSITDINGVSAALEGILTESGEAKLLAFAESVKGAFSSVKEKVGEVMMGIVPMISNLVPVFSNIFSTIGTVVGGIVEAFQGFFSGLKAGFGEGLSSASGFQTGFMTILGMICPPLKMIIMMFQNFGPQIMALVSTITSNLIPVFTTLGEVIGGVASAVVPAIQSALANLIPVIAQIITSVTEIINSVLPVVISLIQQLAPFITQIAQMVGNLVAALAPMIAQLVSQLLPVVTNIIEVIMNVVEAVMPALISILNVVMSVIDAIVPIITNVVSNVVSAVGMIMSAIGPIVSFIGMVISAIMAVIGPIVSFIANIIASIISVIGTVIGVVTGVFSTVFSIVSGVFSNISNFISNVINGISKIINTLSAVFSNVFNGIYRVVSSIMGNVRNFITGVFNGIKTAWNGLTTFVNGVFSGIGAAVQKLVNIVKGFVNGVIGGINGAIGLINLIPGVNIGKIPYLLHGTDDWQGGFARMNEGGRGELTYLPNGTQVIPHDISVKYAKEAARVNGSGGGGEAIDYDRLIGGIASAMGNVSIQNTTTLDGKVLANQATPLIDKNMRDTQIMKERYA